MFFNPQCIEKTFSNLALLSIILQVGMGMLLKQKYIWPESRDAVSLMKNEDIGFWIGCFRPFFMELLTSLSMEVCILCKAVNREDKRSRR